MKKPSFLFALSIIFSVCFSITSCKKDVFSTQQKQVSSTENSFNLLARIETLPPVQKGVSHRIDGNIGGYMESLPYGYNFGDSKRYPLLIALTGIGGLGNGTTTDLSKLINCCTVQNLIRHQLFPANFTVNGNNYSFIVLTPQFRAWAKSSDVNDMVNYAISHYNIDTTKMYVSGQSMGGGNTWDYAIDYGSRLAAIVPISGASWPTTEKGHAIAQADVAVWAFQNNDDKAVPPWYSIDYVNYINSYNPLIPAKLTLWPTGGHNAWTKAYNPSYTENGINIYEWMLSYKKG